MNMEEPKSAHHDQKTKKMVVKIGKSGGSGAVGSVGGLVLLSGALATAVLASAAVFWRQAGKNRRHRGPQPAVSGVTVDQLKKVDDGDEAIKDHSSIESKNNADFSVNSQSIKLDEKSSDEVGSGFHKGNDLGSNNPSKQESVGLSDVATLSKEMLDSAILDENVNDKMPFSEEETESQSQVFNTNKEFTAEEKMESSDHGDGGIRPEKHSDKVRATEADKRAAQTEDQEEIETTDEEGGVTDEIASMENSTNDRDKEVVEAIYQTASEWQRKEEKEGGKGTQEANTSPETVMPESTVTGNDEVRMDTIEGSDLFEAAEGDEKISESNRSMTLDNEKDNTNDISVEENMTADNTEVAEKEGDEATQGVQEMSQNNQTMQLNNEEDICSDTSVPESTISENSDAAKGEEAIGGVQEISGNNQNMQLNNEEDISMPQSTITENSDNKESLILTEKEQDEAVSENNQQMKLSKVDDDNIDEEPKYDESGDNVKDVEMLSMPLTDAPSDFVPEIIADDLPKEDLIYHEAIEDVNKDLTNDEVGDKGLDTIHAGMAMSQDDAVMQTTEEESSEEEEDDESDEEDTSDAKQGASEGTGDESVELNRDAIWPVEDFSLETNNLKLNMSEVEGKSQEDKALNINLKELIEDKVRDFQQSLENFSMADGKENLEMAVIDKYMVENGYCENTTIRRVLIGIFSILTWLFGLSSVKIGLLVFFAVMMSKIHQVEG